MKDFMVLKFLDRFKGFFNAIDINYVMMRKILQLKLIMDCRRVPTIISNSSKRKIGTENNDQNNFIKSLWLYVLIGLILTPFVILGKNFIFQMSIVFGIIMFMVMSSLISDFSVVLLDIRDKNIIGTKPISSKTISMAKTIHILIYMFLLTIAITGPALAICLVKQGILFFVIFLCEIILVDLFIVVFTALFYLLILRFFDGEKLKDIINYVQIGLSIGAAVGYQLIARLFQFVNLNAKFTPKWWQYFIVPVWFGGPFELLINSNNDINYIAFSVLVVVVPIASIIAYIKLMPTFEKNLQKLNTNVSRAQKGNKRLLEVLSRVICSSKEEGLFFKFAFNMMKNEREFKLKVYPTLGFAIAFPFIFLLNDLTSGSLESIASSKLYLNIYFCALMLPAAVMMIKYSTKYKAAWIYRVMPIKNKADIFRGTLKAFVVKLVIPVYFIESIIFTAIFKVRIIPDLFAIFLTMMLFIIICFRVLKSEYPFSQRFEAVQQSEGLIMIPFMLLLAIFVGVHYVLTFINFGVTIYVGALLIINIFAWKYAFNV